MLKAYYNLAKPGIIYGNLLTALAGYFFASHFHFDYLHLIGTMLGLALIMGCGCSLNNVMDMGIDVKMKRTQKRALVTGQITVKNAVRYATGLGLAGFILMLVFSNLLATNVALFGLIAYVVLYGYAKRRTVYSTLVGSISGAIPPLVGYVAVTDSIDLSGLILFMILVTWQLSHFYAISLYRKEEYKAAGIPVWPIVKGTRSTETQILGFIIVYLIFAMTLFIIGDCGFLYLAIILVSGGYWYTSAYSSRRRLSPEAWGKKVFLTSLFIILLTSIALAIGPVTF